MQNKQIKHSYNGMVKDITKSQFPQNYYFEGKNIRILATDSQSTNSITNEKGNELIVTIPNITINPNIINYGIKELVYTTLELESIDTSGEQVIIGSCNSRDALILFTTNNLGCDCIWKLNYENFDLTLLYLRNLGFSINNPILSINNFENEIIDKIYWIDGKEQVKYINVNHSLNNQDLENLIDVPVSVIDMVGKYDLNQPVISSVISGGNHTAGMIQYGYNLYRLNSSQTKISSLSELIPLSKSNSGGGAVNEIVGSLPIVKINNIDSNYTNIRVYAIKYTSFNEIPQISLIDDRVIPESRNIEVFDDGSIINTISLDEFTFLGSDIIIPKNINSKYNRMFLANYKEINFTVNLDTRAYSFPINSTTTTINKDLSLNGLNQPIGVPLQVTNNYNVPEKHDCINLNYDVNRFQYNSNIEGGEGKYLKYSLTQSTNYNQNNRYFKDDEIYRIGIEFFNQYGQKSNPLWIADFKSKSGNLNGNYNTLKVELKNEFLVWLNDTSNFNTKYDIPVGYKVLVAERTLKDKTIVANGFLSSMMVNYKTTDQNADSILANDLSIVDGLPKLPNILVRNCNSTSSYGNTKPLLRNSHLAIMNRIRRSPDTEIQRAYFGDKDTSSRFYQFNSMMQMYSPEILFGQSVSLSEGLTFRIKGLINNTENNSWGREINGDETIADEGKSYDGISSFYSQRSESIVGSVNNVYDNGLIAHPGGSEPNKILHMLFNRKYCSKTNNMNENSIIFKNPVNKVLYTVYGKPEFTEKGQSFTTYNNDPKYRYTNSLESFYSDADTDWQNPGKYGRRVVSVNSYGNRCLTFVLGSESSILHQNRTKLETLFQDSLPAPFALENQGIIGEFVKTNNEIYLGNIYGGNTFEDKKRTNYIEVGNFIKVNKTSTISNLINIIESPGDTFVRNFKFLRITNTDKDIIEEGIYKYEELVEVLCETTVDLKNRNDISNNEWDSKFQYQDSEYHKYNRVYSQISNLIQNRDINYNIKKVNSFDTNVIATKIKSPGELIDSWTDILQNEVITLDGKYGSLNSLINFNDQLYTIQDEAFAFLSINPRVQVQGGDGISVELGSGGVLQEYKYISTKSGTSNKWSVISTPQGIYYYDLLTKSVMMFKGNLDNLSNSKGLHSFFVKNIDLDSSNVDNPLLKLGVSSGYDHLNNTMFMTFYDNVKSTTISYNEMKQQFISLHDYFPSIYTGKGDKFITTSPDLKSIYQQNVGEYNKFYEQYYPSYVILSVNPEADMDTVFDNIMYKSEVYLNDVDQFNKSLTHVQLYNEYQDSGLIPLIVSRNGNLKRKFRDWNAILPRNANSRKRIRNPWVFLKLQFTNNSNYKLILHDIVISYSV